MQSIASLRASNGAANASVVTVQSLRSPGATTIVGNTVSGLPPNFIATMGAPHTFTDPQTGEVITIISEATAVDFAGHVNGSNLVIDTIAPGYTDTRGSLVGDIVILKPTTFYADTLNNVLAQSHNDDGTFKADSITSELPFVDAVDPVLRMNELMFDHIAGGGAVLAGLGYGSTLTASLSSGVCYINGYRQLIAAVATRTYTASKDTYVDALYNASGTATIVYTEVANNAASPALAANSVRLGIVVSGANIAAATSINQGQKARVLPISGGFAYTVTDSLGNLICPRDPNRKILGYAQTLANTSSSGAAETQIAGLRSVVKIPTGRRAKATIYVAGTVPGAAFGQHATAIWQGTVGSGVQVARKVYTPISTGSTQTPNGLTSGLFDDTGAGSYTFNGAVWNDNAGGSVTNLNNDIATNPAYILIELE